MSFIRFSTDVKNVIPLLTLTVHGRITFNKIASERLALENFKYVILFYQEGRQRIKIQFTNNGEEEGALPLLHTKIGACITGKRFLDYFNIRPALRNAYHIKIKQDDTLRINLAKPYNRKWVKEKNIAEPRNKLNSTMSFTGASYQRFTNKARALILLMTLTSYGRMSFNRFCREKYHITSYKYCVLFYDQQAHQIKIRLTNNVKDSGTMLLGNNIYTTHISGKQFLSYFGILPEKTTVYHLHCPRKDEFIVDLNKRHIKTHRIRKPKEASETPKKRGRKKKTP